MKKLSLYTGWSEDIPVEKIKQWLDDQIAKGATHVTVDISWGYYDDIDDINLVPINK